MTLAPDNLAIPRSRPESDKYSIESMNEEANSFILLVQALETLRTVCRKSDELTDWIHRIERADVGLALAQTDPQSALWIEDKLYDRIQFGEAARIMIAMGRFDAVKTMVQHILERKEVSEYLDMSKKSMLPPSTEKYVTEKYHSRQERTDASSEEISSKEEWDEDSLDGEGEDPFMQILSNEMPTFRPQYCIKQTHLATALLAEKDADFVQKIAVFFQEHQLLEQAGSLYYMLDKTEKLLECIDTLTARKDESRLSDIYLERSITGKLSFHQRLRKLGQNGLLPVSAGREILPQPNFKEERYHHHQSTVSSITRFRESFNFNKDKKETGFPYSILSDAEEQFYNDQIEDSVNSIIRFCAEFHKAYPEAGSEDWPYEENELYQKYYGFPSQWIRYLGGMIAVSNQTEGERLGRFMLDKERGWECESVVASLPQIPPGLSKKAVGLRLKYPDEELRCNDITMMLAFEVKDPELLYKSLKAYSGSDHTMVEKCIYALNEWMKDFKERCSAINTLPTNGALRLLALEKLPPKLKMALKLKIRLGTKDYLEERLIAKVDGIRRDLIEDIMESVGENSYMASIFQKIQREISERYYNLMRIEVIGEDKSKE